MNWLTRFFLIKLLLLNLALSSLAQGKIDSLNLLPKNPNEKDLVKIKASMSFPSGPNSIDSFTISQISQVINVNVYYKTGGFTIPTQQMDTITIGQLNPGTYIANLHFFVNWKSTEFDSNSISFEVKQWNGINDFNTLKSKFKVYPNPSNGLFNILNTAKFERIELINLNGTVVAEYYKNQIDLATLPKGMYFVKIIDANSTPYITKVLLTD